MSYLRYSRRELRECVPEMFDRLGLLSHFSIPQEAFAAFVADLCSQMKRVPYHNFTHAFNICHMTYIYLTHSTTLRTLLDPVDLLSVLLGALGHDIGHPGFNNVYF